MNDKVMQAFRVAAIGLALTFGLVTTQAGIAQEEEATEVTDQIAETTDQVEEDAEGFDDWGLFGLLGLLGLAGLLRKPERDVQTVDRTTNPIERPVSERRDDIDVRDRGSNDRL